MFSTGMGLGGAETQICQLTERLIERGHSVQIAWLTGKLDVNPPAQAATHPFNIDKTPLGFARAIAKLRKLILSYQPDVVHAHMVHANLIARLVRLILQISNRRKVPKLICTAHSTNEGGMLLMLAYRLTDRLTDITTHVSQRAAAVFVQKLACKRERIRAVYNGIDTDDFASNYETRKLTRAALKLEEKEVIMAVGRLEPEKNHTALIKVFVDSVKRHPNSHLVLVGHGSLRHSLEDFVSKHLIQDKVTFLGARRDIASLLNAADIVVLPSTYEGFGLVIAEAMSTEKVVIATRTGVVDELLSDVGLAVPVGSDTALKHALEMALRMPNATRRDLGKRARQRVIENFSMNAITDKWISIYQSLQDQANE